MYATKILQYMKIHGQKLDREIAKDTGISLIQVRITIAELQNLKEISSCSVINFENGVAIEGYYVDSLVIFHQQRLVERPQFKR